MKKFIFFSLIVFFAISVNAQKVALHTTSGEQFFNGTAGFVNAYNAATAGDTIYLPGGGFTSPNTISKQLMIYGTGHYPDSTSATSKTIVIGSINLTGDADGFHIEGVEFTGGLTTSANEAVDNILIKYCRFLGALNIQGNLTNPSLNFTIINSVVHGALILTNAQNAGVFNSIFQADIQNTYGNIFQNNIFLLNNYSVSTYRYTIIGDNNTLENNVFIRTRDREIAGTSNILNNNITPKTVPFWGTTPTESGNYINIPVENIFVNQTGNVFDYTHNYHLQLPETYLGVDGTQVGLYGGIFGYKEGAVPSNPHFSKKNIAASTGADGLLHIEINAAAQEK
jgi:hypothetical protein